MLGCTVCNFEAHMWNAPTLSMSIVKIHFVLLDKVIWFRYYVNRDTLFSFHKASEAFLGQVNFNRFHHFDLSLGDVNLRVGPL